MCSGYCIKLSSASEVSVLPLSDRTKAVWCHFSRRLFSLRFHCSRLAFQSSPSYSLRQGISAAPRAPKTAIPASCFHRDLCPLSTSRLICPPRIYMDGRGSSTLGLCLLGNSFSPPSPLPRPGECVLFWETGCSYRLHACLMQGLPHTSEYWTAALALLAPS